MAKKQNITASVTSPDLLLSGASLVIIIAGMKSAQDIVVPFLLSAFIAMICAGPMFWLKSKRFGTVTAIGIIVFVIVSFGSFVGYIFGSSLNEFSKTLPQYNLSFDQLFTKATEFLSGYNIKVPKESLLKHVNPSAVMNLLTGMLSELSAILANAFLILTAVTFMLLEAATIPDKLRNLWRNSPDKSESLKEFSRSFNKYMSIKTGVSLAIGASIAILLSIVGVDYPLLWGLLAFLFNYIPSIGSILATVPVLLIALVTGGVSEALLALVACSAVNTILGNIVEPKLLGKGLGLSTLVVFLSLVFWGWVLGPVGMLLSVPLTMIVKIALESNVSTKRIATLLS